MSSPIPLDPLIARFDADPRRHLSSYNETEARVHYINPLFVALGWDIDNTHGRGEVKHEDRVTIRGKAKAPDYGFRLDGRLRFFVEAKKPAVALDRLPEPAYQLRRYAWTAKLPLSILTDFEEFAVYDTRVRPNPDDSPRVARLRYWRYTDYPAAWDEIAATFSRDAVLAGSLEQFAAAEGGKKGVAPVDSEFLREIERWRDLLAAAIARRNPGLAERDLNFAVQQTIDRLLFLRIAEDRGIEPYGRLRNLTTGAEVYTRLFTLFNQADQRYNSGLFHFQPERGRGDPDYLTPRLTIDDKTLRDIIRNLYEPASPYEFSVFPADILGQVYEQFLGKVIRLKGKSAVVEEKPEVRKAGGVYYTPTYIVDYIVRQTVGKLLEGHAPDPTGPASRLHVLDPACGSGSFLLGAYQYLLDWHLRGYLAAPSKWARGRNRTLHQTAAGDYHLTLAERKRILLDNLYGVDIDPQAVEVTKLSLLLKVLEDTPDALSGQLSLLPDRVLPDLGANIKCGNSLIGPDFYDGAQGTLFDLGEQLRINAFDWRAEFRDIMAAGGFDAVIGNPPYVRSINLKESDHVLWKLYATNYRSTSSREWDIYLIFVEKGLSLLKPNGKLGFILPNKFLNSKVGTNLRAILSESKLVERIVHFGAFQIFQGATTYTCLLFLNRSGTYDTQADRYIGPVAKSGLACPLPEESSEAWVHSTISTVQLADSNWEIPASLGGVLEKLRNFTSLDQLAEVFQGTGTRADKVYCVEVRGKEGDYLRVYSHEQDAEYHLEPAFLKSVLRGRNIGRYHLSADNLQLIVPYQPDNGRYELIPQSRLSKSAPRTLDYLRANKSRLDERENGRFKGPGYYSFGRPQNMHRFEVLEKIVLPDVAIRGTCHLDREQRWLLDTAYAIVLKPKTEIDIRYLLGILNSPLLTYFLKETGTPLRGGYFRMKTAYLNPFPIRTIDFTNPADAARHARMVALVQRMLDLHQQHAAEQNPQVKTLLQRQIDATDRQIDALVYELYGLTDEEIAIVEGNTP